jgi:amino acid transporter
MESNTTPLQAAIRSGLIIGFIMLIINFAIYFVDYTILTAMWYGLFVMVFFFALIIFFGIRYRHERGGYIEFGPAYQFAILTLIICGLISTIGNILLYQVIAPDLPALLADQQLESVLNMLDKFGAGESISSDQLDEMRGEMVESYTLKGQFKAFGFGLIIYAILSLIIAAVIKKKDKSTNY